MVIENIRICKEILSRGFTVSVVFHPSTNLISPLLEHLVKGLLPQNVIKFFQQFLTATSKVGNKRLPHPGPISWK